MTWSSSSDGHPFGGPSAPAHSGESVPTQHRLRTPGCPSLPRLLSATPGDLSPSEQAHTTACPYCQKVIAMAWRHECPRLGALVAHLAGRSEAEAAMREHLDEDRCQRCLRLARSPLIRSAAATLRESRRSVQSLEAWLERAAAVSARLPARVGTFAALDKGPFRVRVELPGGLAIVVRQTDRGVLVAEVESADLRHEGRRVHVEILGEGEPLVADLILRAEGGRCSGRHTFGHLSDLANDLGTSCEVLAALDDQPDAS